MLWTLFIATVVTLLVMVTVTLVEEFDPASQGTPGTAAITHCAGQNTNKQCYGSFRSADGTVHLADTRAWGEDFAKPGQSFPAYYDASDNSVDTVVSGEDLSTNLIVVFWLFALAFVQFIFRVLIPHWRRRRLTLRSTLPEPDEGRR